MISRPLEVLLVEDDPGDITMTQEAFTDGNFTGRLHIARDGVEAMDFLRRRRDFIDAPIPDLVLLDLNLPRLDGHEVLAQIRRDQALTHLPVVVFTTSSAEEDVAISYQLHANAHVAKPADYAGFTRALARIDEFFTSIAELPTTSG